MNIPLLLKLADLLDTIEPEAFDYAYWRVGPVGGKLGDCGTTACALGYATLLPECGLRWVEPPSAGSWSTGMWTITTDGAGAFDGVSLGPLGAACKAFDLTFDQAEALFSPAEPGNDGVGPRGHASPQEVAAWIRQVCRWEGAVLMVRDEEPSA